LISIKGRFADHKALASHPSRRHDRGVHVHATMESGGRRTMDARSILSACIACAASVLLFSSNCAALDRPPTVASFDEAIKRWRSPQEVNAWIGASFRYDRARALQLSETQRSVAGSADVIYTPAAFYDRPQGICVDLARFAVETLMVVSPETRPRYVMIEFDPVIVEGEVLRRHWLASYEIEGRRYFFADSSRPGHIDGPYASLEAFIEAYASFRRQTIVSFQEASTYRRRMKAHSAAQMREDF